MVYCESTDEEDTGLWNGPCGNTKSDFLVPPSSTTYTRDRVSP